MSYKQKNKNRNTAGNGFNRQPSAAKTKKSKFRVPSNEEVLEQSKGSFPLTTFNFILMGGSVLLIIIGFLLMLGGSSTAEQFNPDIFSTRRIVIGPAIAFLGFVAMAYAILAKRPNKASANENKDESKQ